jgi:hypothetical protein
LDELSVTVRSTLTAQSYHSAVELAIRSGMLTIVDEVTARAARSKGLNTAILTPEISVPIVAALAIKAERSALIDHFVAICQKTISAIE